MTPHLTPRKLAIMAAVVYACCSLFLALWMYAHHYFGVFNMNEMHALLGLYIILLVLVLLIVGLGFYVNSMKPKQPEIKVSAPRRIRRRSLRTRIVDTWYFWRAGMGLRNAWVRASKVI